jgi:hypothetical protein
MTALQLYLDVAGHPHDSSILCCAGFASSEQKWLQFEQKWKAALEEHSLGEVFHMTDFEHKFKNRPERWEILEHLVHIISDHTVAAFSNSVEMADYLNVNSYYFLEEGIGKPYGLTARSVAFLADDWNRRVGHGSLSIFVEKGTLHEGDMHECFRRDSLPEPVPVPKTSAHVQAADWYAWELAYAKRHGITRRSLQFMRKLGRVEESVGCWSRKGLKKYMDFFEIPKRIEHPEMTQVVFNSDKRRIRHRAFKD